MRLTQKFIRIAVFTPEELPSPGGSLPDVQTPSGKVYKTFRTQPGEDFGGAEYKVMFKEMPAGFKMFPVGSWEIEFYQKRPGHHNKFEVMQGVAASVRDFIQEYDPTGLIYVPTSQSRDKLYAAMFRRLLPETRVQRSGGHFYVDLKSE